MVELKLIEVPEIIFNTILDLYASKIQIKKDIWNCFCGTPENKKLIYTDNCEWIVCQEYLLDYVHQSIYGTECVSGCTDWKQVRLRKVEGLKNVQQTYNGSYCYNYIMRIIKKFYTDQEIELIFNTHAKEYNDDLKQYHYYYSCDVGELIEFNNFVKYDINGAHASAVIELFPKAEEELLKLYNKKEYYKKRGEIESANKIKALFNYFVGMLCKKGYRGTYNYIVQSITTKLLSIRDEVGGILIYANTDSLAIECPEHEISTSNKLGEMKLEGKGTGYWYRDNNYILLEYVNTKGKVEQVGTCKLAARDYISLKDKQVVHYTSRRELLGYDKNNQPHYKINIENITKENLNGLQKE